MGKSSWFKEVNVAGSRLKFNLEPIALDVTEAEIIEEYRKNVQQSMEKWVLTEIADSEKLYLLHGRKEPRKGKGADPGSSEMRNYLEVTTPKHRDAVVSIALSTHKLAVERLRWNTPRSSAKIDCAECAYLMLRPQSMYSSAACQGARTVSRTWTSMILTRERRVVEKMHDLRRCFWHDLARVTPRITPPGRRPRGYIILEILTR